MSEEGLLMTPRRTDTDGFFVSLLRKSLEWAEAPDQAARS